MNPVNPNETNFFEIIRIEIHAEPFRNLYPHQTVSFRSNPKLVFNPNQSEAH